MSVIFVKKKYSRKENLEAHVKVVHQNIKDNKCGFCNKSFGKVKDLNIHITVSLSRIWFIDEMNLGNGYYSSPDPCLGNQMLPKIENSTEPFWRKLRLKYEI